MARGKWFLPYKANKLNYEDVGYSPYFVQHDIGFSGDKIFRAVKWNGPNSGTFTLVGEPHSAGDTAPYGKRARAADTRKARAKAVSDVHRLAGGKLEENPRMRRRKRNNADARELELFIENDSRLYHSQHQPIIKNLELKKAKGIYDHAKAVKLFRYLVDRADKMYFKQYGSGDGKHVTMSTATRNEVADSLARSFETESNLGNYKHLLPKKYQKNPRAGEVVVRKKAGIGWYLVKDGKHLGVQMTNGDIVGYYANKSLAQKAADRMNEPPVWMPGYRKRHPVKNTRTRRRATGRRRTRRSRRY